MDAVMKALLAQTQELPRRFLEKIVLRKLKAAGVENPDVIAPKLVARIIAGNGGVLRVEDGKAENPLVKIEFTADDKAEIEAKVQDFVTNKISDIVQRTAKEGGVRLAADLKRKWPEQAEYEAAIMTGFLFNLDGRWGKAIDLLKILLTITREKGEDRTKRIALRKRLKEPSREEVLLRLHARGCQVAEEIILLLENGLADGAMARWRTLHEIDVVATLIGANGEDLARRYIDHQVIEAKAGMEEYERISALEQTAVTTREKIRILRDYDAAISKYGKPFASPYGWAAKLLNKAKPLFGDLEVTARHASTRPYYRMASHNVHAGAKGTFFRLSAIDGRTAIAGRSNAGLADPGFKTSQSLVLLTLTLYGPKFQIMDMVAMQAIVRLGEDAQAEFMRAHRRLLRDDARNRRDAAKTTKGGEAKTSGKKGNL